MDFTHSFWQLGLGPDSQEGQYIITPDPRFSPKRVFHGTINALLHLQSFLANKPSLSLRDRILLWLYDCLFPEETVDGLLRDLHNVFAFYGAYNCILNPQKGDHFRPEARLCGRIISPNGIRFDH